VIPKLFLAEHLHRSEHWSVERTATVTVRSDFFSASNINYFPAGEISVLLDEGRCRWYCGSYSGEYTGKIEFPFEDD
jgi:hypothetical protein